MADVLVLACGRLTEPSIPRIAGLESFPGPLFHSARWDHSADLAGARVGIVGTGASAIQIVPELARTAAHVTLFQRTPAWIVPRGGDAYSDADRARFAATPQALEALRADLYAEGEARFASRAGDSEAAAEAEAVARAHLERQVPDPALRAALTPDYAFGCKRVLLSDDFYPAVASDAVTLVRGALTTVEGSTLIGSDGSRHEVDALVLATGFASTRQPYADLVSGEGGVTLAAHWSQGMTSFASTVVSGFPNMFVLNGPNASLGHSSSVLMIEEQAAYVTRVLGGRDGRVLRVDPDAERSYTDEIAQAAASTRWITGGCRNWYVDERSGRLTLLWPGTVDAFRARLARADGSEFEDDRRHEPRRHPRPSRASREEQHHDLSPAVRLQGLGRAVRTQRAVRIRSPRRGDGLRLGVRLRPPAAVAARGRPRPGIHPLARRARRPHVAGAHRHVGAHADVPLQPDGDRAGLRDPRRHVPRTRHPRRRHRRSAQRGEPRLPVARPARAVPAPQGGDRPHPAPLDRGARQPRGHVLHDPQRHDLRQARPARADLHRRRRACRHPARGTHRRRLHHDVGQGVDALHRHPAARAARRAREGRSPRRRDRHAHGGQGLVPPRPRGRPREDAVLGAARPERRREDGHRRPDRDAAPRRAAADRARGIPLHRLDRPRRARRADLAVRRHGLPPPRVPRPGARPGAVPARVRRPRSCRGCARGSEREPERPDASAQWAVIIPVKPAAVGKSRLDAAGRRPRHPRPRDRPRHDRGGRGVPGGRAGVRRDR